MLGSLKSLSCSLLIALSTFQLVALSTFQLLARFSCQLLTLSCCQLLPRISWQRNSRSAERNKEVQRGATLRDECSNFATKTKTKTGTKTKTEWEREWERKRKRKRKRNGNGNGNENGNGNYEGADLIEFMRPDSCFSISTIRFSRSACCSSDTYPMFLAINS